MGGGCGCLVRVEDGAGPGGKRDSGVGSIEESEISGTRMVEEKVVENDAGADPAVQAVGSVRIGELERDSMQRLPALHHHPNTLVYLASLPAQLGVELLLLIR